jgi:gliding motility-associated-like protein
LTEFSILNIQNNRYIYEDKNIEPGKTYCYRILAEFARTTPNGRYAYNLVESLPSEEICIQLGRDLPLPIEVNVKKTAVNGSLNVCWIRPKPEMLDTVNNPPPYTFVLSRGTGINATDFKEIWRSPAAGKFSALKDTCYLDSLLDTQKSPYAYKITFLTGNDNRVQGTTNQTSSVFLSGSGADKSAILSWNFQTTWENNGFTIYRKNNAGIFDSIGFTKLKSFTDLNLTNGKSYCYLIKSWGTYGVVGLPDPIFNFSQEICLTPSDNQPPCPPTLKVNNFCVTGIYPNCDEIASKGNELNWAKANDCKDDDIVGYNLYYAAGPGKTEIKVMTLNGANQNSTRHIPPSGLAGCYRITAFDANGNESKPSEQVCSVNCPVYELPNAFTPNGDGKNDVYTPRKSCFIAAVDFKVFNRWGQLVFQTSEPSIQWDGNQQQGQKLPSGTYYYVCKVFENSTDGLVPFGGTLSGYIELHHGND